MKTIPLCAAVLALSAAGALAQTSVTTTTTATATGTAGAQASAVRCGGVGDEDQQRMKAEAAKHGVLVTFATAGGAYVADVDYEVRREGKVVLQGRCGGPLMLLDLAPAGTYEITATSQGRTQKQAVSAGGKPSGITFRFAGS